jgi:hypothetical protein
MEYLWILGELGSVHKIRTHLGGGGQRFVTYLCKNIGICTVLHYKGEGSKISKNLRTCFVNAVGAFFFLST